MKCKDGAENKRKVHELSAQQINYLKRNWIPKLKCNREEESKLSDNPDKAEGITIGTYWQF